MARSRLIRKISSSERDRADGAIMKARGELSHINSREDKLLEALLPHAHGKVVKSGLLAEAGRGRDDRVTRLIPQEEALLKAAGGSGAINPATGLREYDDSEGPGDGTGGNTSSAGENTGGMDGTANSGVSDGPGANGGYGSNDGGYSGYGGYSTPNSLGYAAYDPTTMPSIESLLNTPSGYRAQGYEGLSMMQYSPPDTLSRLVETYLYGPPPSYKARGTVPGRYDAPTGLGPGIMGTMVGKLAGGPMGGFMSLGQHMDMAMSPASRAASLAENAAIGSMNSTGQDRDSSSGLSAAEMAARAPSRSLGQVKTGTAPGAPGSDLTAPVGDPTNANPMLASTDEGRRARLQAALPNVIQDELLDYVWRGRGGLGGRGLLG